MSTHIIQKAPFDRDLGIRELLEGIDLDKLEQSLATLLGTEYRIVDTAGQVVAGNTDAALDNKIALQTELEPIAYIEASASKPMLQAAAKLLQILLRSALRYHMASDLHLESVRADYEKLQVKHQALTKSEERYKSLAENLEQRVQQQVKIIETAQRKLYNSEKMASVGQLAAGVAHEINNPIGFIRSNLSSARSYVDKISEFAQQLKHGGDLASAITAWQSANLDYILGDFAELLTDSIDGADRVARIVADLKGFSNVDRAEEEVVNINEIIRSVCNVAHSQIAEKAEVKLDLGELPASRCLPGHIGQVLLNILLNATQAISKRPGTILIRSKFDNNEIVITIKDNGSGIPVSNLDKIFEPFYTTRDVNLGTGLGLTVCQDIVSAHNGRIEVASEPGNGSAFTIHLPLKD